MTVWSRHTVQSVFGVYSKLGFLIASGIKLPFLLVAEKFVAPADRISMWRLAARKHSQLFLKLSRVKLHLPDDMQKIIKDNTPAVFISNHPSLLDGFICFSFLGPEVVPLTEPFERVPFPLNIWFKKSGFVDVFRDANDYEHCHLANEKKTAICKLIECIQKQKLNVLIFPEGHYERQHKLHYIHTGAARVAISAHVPVIPVVLNNVDRVALDEIRSRPGQIHVRYGKPLLPPQISMKLPFRRATVEFSETIRSALVELLDPRNVPNDITDTHPEQIGAFIDIDNTLYRGYSQQDFVKELMKKKKISRMSVIKIFFYLLQEKCGLLSHKNLMIKALGFTKNWKERDLTELATDFFDTHIQKKIETHMLPVIKDHQERGHSIFLVSEVIEPLAKHFKNYFEARDMRCTIVQKKEGIFTGAITRLCWHEEKAIQVRNLAKKHGIDLKKSYVYGDSISDAPMLELAKNPTVVNPDKKLKELAIQKKWDFLV
ncbi:MAG: HAD-IB family hydrolase [Candidatus Magasanikbacteria bacterium]